MQAIYYLPKEVSVTEGELIRLHASHDAYSLWFSVSCDDSWYERINYVFYCIDDVFYIFNFDFSTKVHFVGTYRTTNISSTSVIFFRQLLPSWKY